MSDLTVNLWTVGSDNKLRAVGHTEPRPKPGDLCSDPATGDVTRFIADRGRLQRWPLWMFKPVAAAQPVS